MSEIPHGALRSPAVWTGRDQAARTDWIHELRPWLTSRRAFADSGAALNAGMARKDGVASDAASIATAR